MAQTPVVYAAEEIRDPQTEKAPAARAWLGALKCVLHHHAFLHMTEMPAYETVRVGRSTARPQTSKLSQPPSVCGAAIFCHRCRAVAHRATSPRAVPEATSGKCQIAERKGHSPGQTSLKPSRALHALGCTALSRLYACPGQFPLRLSVPTIIKQRETLPDGLDSLTICHSAKLCHSRRMFSPGATYAKPADAVNLAPAAQWRGAPVSGLRLLRFRPRVRLFC
jgi:hypothetical protein